MASPRNSPYFLDAVAARTSLRFNSVQAGTESSSRRASSFANRQIEAAVRPYLQFDGIGGVQANWHQVPWQSILQREAEGDGALKIVPVITIINGIKAQWRMREFALESEEVDLLLSRFLAGRTKLSPTRCAALHAGAPGTRREGPAWANSARRLVPDQLYVKNVQRLGPT